MKTIRSYISIILTIFSLLTVCYSQGGYAGMKIQPFTDENGQEYVNIELKGDE